MVEHGAHDHGRAFGAGAGRDEALAQVGRRDRVGEQPLRGGVALGEPAQRVGDRRVRVAAEAAAHDAVLGVGAHAGGDRQAIAARPRLRERGGREQPQIGLLGRPAELAVGRLVGDGAVARRSLVRVGAAREEQGDEVRVLARGRLLQRREAGGPAGIDGHAEVEQDLHGVAAAAGRQAAEDVRLGAAQQPRRVGVLGGEVTRGRPVAGQARADQRVERLGAAPRAERGEQVGEVWPAAAHGEAVGRATAAVEGRLEVRAVLDEQPHHLRRRLGVHGPLQRVLALAPVAGAALEQHPRRAQPSALRRVGQRHRADEPRRPRRAAAPGRPGRRRRPRRAAIGRRRGLHRPRAAARAQATSASVRSPPRKAEDVT